MSNAAATRRSARTQRKRIPDRTAGAVTGVVLLSACGALVAASIVAEAGGAAQQLPVPVVEVPAGEYTAVCPEPPRLLEGGAQLADPEFSPVSETARTVVGALVLSDLGGRLPGSSLSPLGMDEPLATIATAVPGSAVGSEPPVSSNEDGLTGRSAGVLPGREVDGPSVFTAQSIGGQGATAGALLSYTASDGDLQGLAVANCRTPGDDFWILGAATTIGTTSVLKLYNPSDSPATVNLELHNARGPLEAAGGRGVLVAPGESVSIVLAGLAAGQAQLAVRVVSDGGRVSAGIQQSVLRGLTPGGVELLQPSAPDAFAQVIPGVRIQNSAVGAEISGQEGYESALPVLTVVVPGGSDTVLDVRAYGESGEITLQAGAAVRAAAGTVTEIPLDSLPEGDYTIEVRSDVLVSAAARVSQGTGAGEPVDFASAPAGERLGSQHVAVFADGASTDLVFGAPMGRSDVAITPVSEDGTLGQEQIFSLEEGTTVTVPVDDLGGNSAAALVSASGDPVYGAQVHTQEGDAEGISVTPLPPATTGQQGAAVNLGY